MRHLNDVLLDLLRWVDCSRSNYYTVWRITRLVGNEMIVELSDDEMGMVLHGLAVWSDLCLESVNNLRKVGKGEDFEAANDFDNQLGRYNKLYSRLNTLMYEKKWGPPGKLCNLCNGPVDAEWHTQEAQDRKLEDDEPVGHAFQE